jgi:metalloendopeptidase OMA1, mitochondrial
MIVGQVALGFGIEYFVFGNMWKTRELEADRLGMVLAAKAGFEPRAATDIWRKLSSAPDQSIPNLSPVCLFC